MAAKKKNTAPVDQDTVTDQVQADQDDAVVRRPTTRLSRAKKDAKQEQERRDEPALDEPYGPGESEIYGPGEVLRINAAIMKLTWELRALGYNASYSESEKDDTLDLFLVIGPCDTLHFRTGWA